MITIGNASVLRARLSMPQVGRWMCKAKIDLSTVPLGAATLACDNGFSLVGAIVSGGVVLDSAHVNLVGGAGGLDQLVSGAWNGGQLRDPLRAIAAASGEALSGTIDPALLGVPLERYTLIAQSASAALSALAAAASAALNDSVSWRVLPDGTIWLGVETWPAASLPDTDEVLMPYPAEGRTVIGVSLPSLLPGVALAGVGNVAGVEHIIQPDRVRTWAYAA